MPGLGGVLVNARSYDINQPLEIQPKLIFAASDRLAIADEVDVKAGFTVDRIGVGAQPTALLHVLNVLAYRFCVR
jgi:hypothetical protein